LASHPASLYAELMNTTALLELAFTLADQAARAILAIRAEGFETMHKADASIVTIADHAAEAIIVAALRQATPDIPVVAEEEMAAGHVPDSAEYLWLVDPLDGTREFAAGTDDFAVCIGLVRNGVPVLGVVGGPAYGTLYGGIVGGHAIKRDSTGEHVIHVRPVPEEGLTVVASRRSANHGRMAPFLEGRKVAHTLHAGSALKFCRIAEGLADLYPRFGRTMEWDTAAAQAMLEAAGGSVRDAETGLPLRYGKPSFENPHFVAAGHP
jgi:3'(2'), 5'-bisphosphate nucleotidase